MIMNVISGNWTNHYQKYPPYFCKALLAAFKFCYLCLGDVDYYGSLLHKGVLKWNS